TTRFRSAFFAAPRACAIAEARGQLHIHLHAAFEPLDPAYDQRFAVQRHEIGDTHPTGIATVELGAEHQGVGFIMTLDFLYRWLRSQLPEAVLLVAEQPGETGG